jgi:hypothetical protein
LILIEKNNAPKQCHGLFHDVFQHYAAADIMFESIKAMLVLLTRPGDSKDRGMVVWKATLLF